MLPKLDPRRAAFVLTKIDEILAWEKRHEAERDSRFVELGRYLCEVRAGQYWRVEKLASFDDFLERRFPESRRKAYYLMSIHEHLPAQVRKELKEIGWTKGRELVKLARRDGQRFDCAPWVHKAREMPREDFRRAVEKELTGKEEEPSELVYFKLYKSQIPVIEQAIETAARMLGSDKSRGYCLEIVRTIRPQHQRLRLPLMRMENYAAKYFSATVGDAKAATPWKGWKFIISNFGVNRELMTRRT